jgi:hypothetical protein
MGGINVKRWQVKGIVAMSELAVAGSLEEQQSSGFASDNRARRVQYDRLTTAAPNTEYSYW